MILQRFRKHRVHRLRLATWWFVAAASLVICPRSLAGGALTPADGASLNARHVLFTFAEVSSAVRYQMHIVQDDGLPDPFDNPPVVDVEFRRTRRIVKEGLAFGSDYAWRVRGIDSNDMPRAWSDTYRFSIDPIPSFLVEAVEFVGYDPQRYQPGITLTMLAWVPDSDGFYTVAFDELGEFIWFFGQGWCDTRMVRNGNILGAFNGAIREKNLRGVITWAGVTSSDIDHHEAFDMPNGNVMYIADVVREVIRDDEPQPWLGQRIVEVNRDGDEVWSWDPFDHLSTLDFDECVMQFPDSQGVYDWTHANAATYDAVEDVVYYSSRHLSRIVKIDHATGDVIWNMGFDMPSGEVDFGDDLFSFQHAPEVLPNGNLLLYDNGNRRGHSFCTVADPYSTAIELKIDPEADVPVTVVWQFEHVFSSFVGDADRLPNGNTLVGAGGSGHLFEVAADGTVVWEICAAPGATWMYRADRIPSLYPLRGDADGDDDVDLLDFGAMQACFGGTDVTTIHRWCLKHDLDEDGDIDLEDFNLFDAAFTGDGL